jgi:hypothetical protein
LSTTIEVDPNPTPEKEDEFKLVARLCFDPTEDEVEVDVPRAARTEGIMFILASRRRLLMLKLTRGIEATEDVAVTAGVLANGVDIP